MYRGVRPSIAGLVLLLGAAGVTVGSPRVLAADGRVVITDASSDAMQWGYDPVSITIPAGAAVVWHNGGSQVHTVTADDKSFDSPDEKPGADFQQKFPAPGDYAYHCTPHPWMKGVVHVVGASTPSTAPAPPPATRPGSPATTATSAPAARAAAGDATTTTTRPATGQSPSTTTTAAAAVTTTTAGAAAAPAPAAAAAPAPEAATTTTSVPAVGEQAAGPGGHSRGGKTNVPLVTLAGVFTLLLVSLTMRLLVAKS
jgi:plastocyanin